MAGGVRSWSGRGRRSSVLRRSRQSLPPARSALPAGPLCRCGRPSRVPGAAPPLRSGRSPCGGRRSRHSPRAGASSRRWGGRRSVQEPAPRPASSRVRPDRSVEGRGSRRSAPAGRVRPPPVSASRKGRPPPAGLPVPLRWSCQAPGARSPDGRRSRQSPEERWDAPRGPWGSREAPGAARPSWRLPAARSGALPRPRQPPSVRSAAGRRSRQSPDPPRGALGRSPRSLRDLSPERPSELARGDQAPPDAPRPPPPDPGCPLRPVRPAPPDAAAPDERGPPRRSSPAAGRPGRSSRLGRP